MIPVQKLLEPISAGKPCGDSLAYDPEFQKLAADIRGKPETQAAGQIKPAEEPNWKDIRDRSLTLLARSKDLQIVMYLTVALLKLEGLAGFHDGVSLLRQWLERYWDSLHPQLDPDDKNDPTERLNILGSMSKGAGAMGSMGDPLRFLERVSVAPLSQSSKMGRFSLADITRSESGAPGPGNKPPPAMSQIETAFRDTPPDVLRATSEAVADTMAQIKGIDAFLTGVVGTDRAPSWDQLNTLLGQIQRRLGQHMSGGAPVLDGPTGGPSGTGTVSAAGGGGTFTGTIQSRQDVIRALDQICQFYRQREPSSPIPFILARAKRLVEMDYIQIINELTPEALDKVKTITGHSGEADKAEKP
jgi:type VI secretion system protein ImpA